MKCKVYVTKYRGNTVLCLYDFEQQKKQWEPIWINPHVDVVRVEKPTFFSIAQSLLVY
jgi:hypothetical protein